jgi:hypothetical protein
MLIDAGWSACERGSQGTVDLGDHPIGWHAFAVPSPLVIARGRAHRTSGQECHLSALREGRTLVDHGYGY